ncbi:MAG: TIGR01212 family radical SAM protein [Lachnospiraceae bacterium]|nr:TIGR01212 family radical SAM protein [Lachnospiraceae bacterium]
MRQRTLNEYITQKYGKKLYKLALNAGFTCPNRDGTKGRRGCIFCLGSGEFAEDPGISITEQIELAKRRVADKLPQKGYGYIAYFQPFTNTYAPVDELRKIYMEAADHPDIDIISIATRCDCLPDDVLDLISQVNEIKPVWVELGLQTIHEKSSEYIRSGFSLADYDEAVKNLQERHIETIVHVILGLPGETAEDMTETVKYVGQSGVQGIKLQLLHVLRGTDLAEDYLAGRFSCLTLEEYTGILKRCLDVLPDDMVIHRLTGDGDKKLLIAPKWSADKKMVLNSLRRRLNIRN